MNLELNKGLLLLSLFSLGLAACAGTPTPPPPSTEPELPPDNGTAESQPESAFYVDTAELLIAESYPIQVSLQISGNLPTPCHEFHYRYVISPSAEEKQVNAYAYSTADPSFNCTQVLQPFDTTVSIPMEGAPDGTYKVYLNGELIGEFTYPGG